MLGDCQKGNLFSAGLDSSYIALLMQKYLEGKINLYYFESELNNYEKYYKGFVENNNFNLKKLKIDDRQYYIDLPEMVYHYECSAKEEASPIALLAKQASKNNDTVLLTGDGDTILGGSRCHASYFARSSFYNNFLESFSLNYQIIFLTIIVSQA